MSEKKRKDDVKRRLKQQRAKRQSGSVADARIVELDIRREIRYVTELAQAGDARLVTLGSFVLFSTETQDAWLLDVEDGLALCLVRAGEPQPHRVVEAPATFAIAWNAQFEIRGELFVVTDGAGKSTPIFGYPTSQIRDACARIR